MELALPLLDGCFDGVARRLRTRVLCRSGADFSVRLEGLSLGSFEELLARPEGADGGLWCAWTEPGGVDSGLVVVDGELLRALLGRMFGDTGSSATGPELGTRRLTPLEQRVGTRVIDEVCAALEEHWPTRPGPSTVGRRTMTTVPGPGTVRSDTRVVIATIVCGSEEAPIGSVTIALSTGQLRGLAQVPSAPPPPRSARFDRVLPVSVELIVELARVTVRMRRLRELQVGEELALGVAREVCGRVSGHAAVYGEAGASGTQRSLRVRRRAAHHSPVNLAGGTADSLRREPRGVRAMDALNNLTFLQDFPVEVTVELGRTSLTIRELAELGENDVIPLDRPNDRPVDLVAGGRVLARGEPIVVGDRLSLRIVEIVGDEPARRVG